MELSPALTRRGLLFAALAAALPMCHSQRALQQQNEPLPPAGRTPLRGFPFLQRFALRAVIAEQHIFPAFRVVREPHNRLPADLIDSPAPILSARGFALAKANMLPMQTTGNN